MTITLFENSLVAFDFAEQYFIHRPNSQNWHNSTFTVKEQALIFATLKINNFNFIGNKKTPSQPLEFPRDFLPELPFEIQYAVCEEALALLENSAHQKNKNHGISSVTIGKSSVSYFRQDNSSALLSKEALNFISKWTAKNFDIT